MYKITQQWPRRMLVLHDVRRKRDVLQRGSESEGMCVRIYIYIYIYIYIHIHTDTHYTHAQIHTKKYALVYLVLTAHHPQPKYETEHLQPKKFDRPADPFEPSVDVEQVLWFWGFDSIRVVGFGVWGSGVQTLFGMHGSEFRISESSIFRVLVARLYEGLGLSTSQLQGKFRG